ncbi:hypothetical protein CVT26_009790 [Gymnopilus dilepis]|uniref:Glycopeptide n=1 Tax=Gymnopilus dilepis TaxID=231916 RepID=A0A409YI63_9AGAR|nr:hypothetical protein CVT26_009790 [Gymnopilus dilepis]
MFSVQTLSFVLAALVMSTSAERHTVHFVNKCGYGTPMLIQGPRVLSTGQDYTINGPLTGAIGYYNGCDGHGADCTNANCPAFRKPDDTWVQVACQTNDVNLAITFCS